MNIKNLFIAIGMAAGLFVYGYLFSTTGHDHAAHSQNNHGSITTNEPSHGHEKHDHEKHNH